jgi:fibronectin-binding autotransporter adhesin
MFTQTQIRLRCAFPSIAPTRLRKRSRLVSRALAASAAALLLSSGAAVKAAVPAPGSWGLMFDDEFNGNSLDQMKWNYNYPWSQHGLQDDSVEQASQVAVTGGTMNFTAVNAGQNYGGTWYNYASGAVNTEGKVNFTYGYIEASQKMASQQGVWPAFWMLQGGWPPEIDIEEVPAFSANPTQYNTAYHYSNSSGGAASAGPGLTSHGDLSAGYNNYGVDWEPTSLTFYFNGGVVGSISGSQANIAQAAGMYLLLDMGVGGWPGEPASGAAFPATMETDWVRVWQHPAGATTNNYIATVSGNWDTTGNWSNGSAGAPNISTQAAAFTGVGSNPITVSWTGTRTVNGLTFSSPTAYTIGGTTATGDVNGVVTGSGAGIMITSADGVAGGAESIYLTQTAAATGGTTINARLEVPDSTLNLIVANASAAQLKLNGDLIGTGNVQLSSGATVINGNDQMSGSVTLIGGSSLTVNGKISAAANLLIGNGSVNIASGASVASTNWSSVGNVTGYTTSMTLNGSMSATGDFNVADLTGTTGTLTMSSTGSLAVDTLYVGKSGTANGTFVQNGGSVSGIGGATDWRIGGSSSTADAAAVGLYNMSAGTFAAPGNLMVGAYGHGTFLQSGGTVSVNNYLSIGRFAGGVGTYNISGNATLTANTTPDLIVGEQGTGTLNISGTATVNAATLSIAHSDGTNATGTVNQSAGTLVVASSGVEFGTAASGTAVATGTYNFNGGTLKSFSITQNPLATVSGTFNFNGGTLFATANNPNSFVAGISKAVVQTGGATVNTSGFTVTASQNLQHDPTLGSALDGGLTKVGSGTLILDAAQSTYNGKTTVSGGTLRLSNAPVLPTGGEVLDLDASTLSLSNGAAVTSLGDSSVSHNTAGVTVAGDDPTFNSNTSSASLNGHGTININAGSQGLTTAANVGITGNSGRTMFSVIRRDVVGTNNSALTTHIGATGTSTDYGISDEAGHLFLPYSYGNDSTTTPQPAGTWELDEAVHVAGGSPADIGYVDGAQATSTTLATLNTTNAPAQIGFRSGDALQNDGDFAEMIVYNTALTTAQRQAVEAYLNYKWFGAAIAPGNNILPATTAVSIAAGSILDLNGNNQTIASLTGSIGSLMTLGTGNLTVAGTTSTEFDGVLSGTGGVTQQGPATLTFGRAGSYSGPTLISGGAITVGPSGSLPSTSITVQSGGTLNDNGTLSTTAGLADAGIVNFGANPGTGILVRKAGVMSITGQAYVAPAAIHSNRVLLSVAGLSLGGNSAGWTGKLDLANNDLDVQNAGTAGLANMTSQVQEAFNNGSWSGTAGVFSSAAAGDGTSLTTLGIMLNNDGNGNAIYGSSTALGLFDGTSPGVNDLLVKYTYFGDANLDGQVDGSDYTLIDNGFNNHLTGWVNGDFNYDGKIDGSDYTLIDNAYNTQGGNLDSTALIAAATAQIDGGSSVPEPASIGMMIGVGSMLAARRRRRDR